MPISAPSRNDAARVTNAAAGSAVMALNVGVIWAFTGGYAVHLCGWTAVTQCDTGTRLFWFVPITVASAVSPATCWFYGRDGGYLWCRPRHWAGGR